MQGQVNHFMQRFGLRVPILLAPMAGACPPALSAAVASAGGLGACGALLLSPDQIAAWAQAMRRASNGPFQINLWVPDAPPQRDPGEEAAVRAFLAEWGPPVPPEAGGAPLQDFKAQCDAVLQTGPAVVSSIMGLFSHEFVAALKARGVLWLATVTTVAEALAAEAAGADAVVAQGIEAGGHRGAFVADAAERGQAGLFALVPAVVDAVRIPVVAAGGIADARGVAAALLLGASAVQIGTGFLRCPEAGIAPAWADALPYTTPDRTEVTRAFSGRAGRGIRTAYVTAAAAGPPPAPYPVQRGLTSGMRAHAVTVNDLDRMQAWAGQAAALAQAQPAGPLTSALWSGASALLQW